MTSYSLYGINFYDEALENLKRYIKKYPGDKNIIYAHYLNAIIYYEQISDEKKDLQPLLKATEKIEFFLEKYPDISLTLIVGDKELDLGMREADVAIRLSPPRQPDLIQRHLFTGHVGIFASKKYIEKNW